MECQFYVFTGFAFVEDSKLAIIDKISLICFEKKNEFCLFLGPRVKKVVVAVPGKQP